MTGTKQYTKCGEVRPVGEFHRRKDRPCGYQSQCKECVREPARRRAAKWHAENREHANEGRRERYQQRSPEQRDRDIDRDRARRKAPEYKEYQRRYRERNRDKLRAYHAEWRKANPEKMRQYRADLSDEARANAAEYHRARKAEQRAVLDAYKREVGCIDCGTSIGELDFDHRDGEAKRWAVMAALGCSWEALWAETAKCDVRCRSCHSRRHAEAGDTTWRAAA